jgi:ubiquinol-cytochrome c reductase cytochrome b subunit
MGLSIVSLILLPIIDKKTLIKTPKIRFLWKWLFWFFVFNFIFLGWLGEQPAEEFYVFLGQISTFFYFLSIWFLIPFIGRIETLLLSKKETELKN